MRSALPLAAAALCLFGAVVTPAMILALVADLTILRPVITFLRSTRMT
jgi:hypothetical protein